MSLALVAGLTACGNKSAITHAETEGVYVDLGQAEVPGPDLAPAEPQRSEDRSSSRRPATDARRPTTPGSRCSCAPQNTTIGPAAGAASSRSPTPRTTTTSRSRSTRATRSPTTRSASRPADTMPGPDSVAATDVDQRRAAALQDPAPATLDNRPLVLQIHDPTNSGRRVDERRPRRVAGAPRRLAQRPRCSTPRAAGAAVSPPAPVATSSTPTATRGRARGREGGEPGVGVGRVVGAAVGRARTPGCRASGVHVWVTASSAVPVLPATSTPGIARARRCRSGRPPTISRSTCARPRLDRAGRRAACRRAGGRGSAAAAARRARSSRRRCAICSAVACTRPWPIADEPTARSSPISLGRRDRARRRAGDAGRLVEAEALGRRRRAAGAELGAQRGEDRVAGDRERVAQRAAAGLAVGVLRARRRSSVAAVCEGKVSLGVAEPASSAPVSVTILNVEPGGCRPLRTRCRRRARISPVRGRIATTPPRRPASAVTAASLRPRARSSCGRRAPGRGALSASTRAAGAAGRRRGARRGARRRSARSPLMPTWASAG